MKGWGGDDSPVINRRRHRHKASGIRVILRIPCGIALVGNAHDVASIDMIGGESQAPQAVGRLDDGRGKAHLDVPLDVAVEEPDARVGRLEAQHEERVGHDGDRVAHGRGAGVVDVAAGPVACVAAGAVQDLEVVAVEVEGMAGGVDVVDDYLDNVAVVDDEGDDGAVDGLVRVVFSRCRGGVEGRHGLADIGDVVETGAKPPLELPQIGMPEKIAKHLPRVPVLVEAELEVELNQLVV